MKREEIADLAAFVTVAEERSFTRAAARLGISQSTLSQIIKRLEERLGVLLVARTTRSVAPTEAGQRLIDAIGPALGELKRGLDALGEYTTKPMGTIRITAVEHAAHTILSPALGRILPRYPELTVEVHVDYGLVDIVADHFDAGVRLGSQVAQDMIAVPISPAVQMAIVGAPAYFVTHPKPRDARDLEQHRCINLRLPTSNAFYAWRVMIAGKPVNMQVNGPAIFNSIDLIRHAALAGIGLALLPLDQVAAHIESGALISVLGEFVPPLPAYHLYFANRRYGLPGFRLLVDDLRYRG